MDLICWILRQLNGPLVVDHGNLVPRPTERICKGLRWWFGGGTGVRLKIFCLAPLVVSWVGSPGASPSSFGEGHRLVQCPALLPQTIDLDLRLVATHRPGDPLKPGKY